MSPNSGVRPITNLLLIMTEPRQIKLSIISIWIGVLIPIVAAIISYGYKYLSSEHDLVFELVGPIFTTQLNWIIGAKEKNWEGIDR